MTVLNLVYPDLKSAPATQDPYFSANSKIAECSVFYGIPLRYVTFSIIAA